MDTINTANNPTIPTAPSSNAGIFNHAVKALIAHAEAYCLPHPHEIREHSHPSGLMRIEVHFDRAAFRDWMLTVIQRSESNDVRRLPGALEPVLHSKFEVTLPDTGVQLVFAGYRDLPLGVVVGDFEKAGA